MMLQNSNLMFTNATQLNDPFDCHPALFDYSNAPELESGWPSAEFISSMEEKFNENQRYNTWICSLSEVHDSLLMWSYYNKHQGICVGIDMEKAKPYLDRMLGSVLGCMEMKVQYKNIVEKPDYFRDKKDLFKYQLATKAKEWEHEKEVRLISYKPSPIHQKLLPNQIGKKELDGKEVHVFAELGGDCFESVYLGVNINEKDKENIIKVAKERNSEIKIYQMKIDSDAFKLKEELIN